MEPRVKSQCMMETTMERQGYNGLDWRLNMSFGRAGQDGACGDILKKDADLH